MEGRQLTNNQIVLLARAISGRDMESIALGYLGIEQERIDSLRDERRGSDAFKRSLIRDWMYRNSGDNQVQVSQILGGVQSL